MTSKIHRATVTQADLHYVGSVTIDSDLLDAAGLLEGEQVTIVDIDNGNRLTTYAIEGERGSGIVCINGAAARLVNPGDVVILIAYSQLPDDEARTYLPRVVFVDEHNHVVDRSAEPGGVPTEGVGADVARLQGLRPSGIPLAEARACAAGRRRAGAAGPQPRAARP